jgi:cytidine deaminase
MDVYNFPYQHYLKNELPEEMQKLADAATAATELAYAPYSKFKVGASVLMSDGTILSGANQENASYPIGVCAERAVLAGIHVSEDYKVKAIAVTFTSDAPVGDNPIAPCGMCRQSILEMQHRQDSPIAIYMCGPGGKVIMIEDAEFLLPFSFGSKDLPSFKPQV